jgi:hypothetical protein
MAICTINSSRLAVLALATFAASAAVAAVPAIDPSKGVCFDAQYAEEPAIEKLGGELEWAAITLPGVPPEEEHYLQSESIAALTLFRDSTPTNGLSEQSDARFSALSRRPLYFVWKVRQSLAPARAKVTAIMSGYSYLYSGDKDAQRLQLATEAANSVNQYVVNLADLLAREEFRPTLGLTGDQRLRLRRVLLDANPLLARYAACKFARVMAHPVK